MEVNVKGQKKIRKLSGNNKRMVEDGKESQIYVIL